MYKNIYLITLSALGIWGNVAWSSTAESVAAAKADTSGIYALNRVVEQINPLSEDVFAVFNAIVEGSQLAKSLAQQPYTRELYDALYRYLVALSEISFSDEFSGNLSIAYCDVALDDDKIEQLVTFFYNRFNDCQVRCRKAMGLNQKGKCPKDLEAAYEKGSQDLVAGLDCISSIVDKIIEPLQSLAQPDSVGKGGTK
jgi:hypothetical protein